MATQKQKLEALQQEYWALIDERPALEQRIKREWTTLDVQAMRRIERRLMEIDARILSIKRLKNYASISEHRVTP